VGARSRLVRWECRRAVACRLWDQTTPADRDRHFDPNWTSVVLELADGPTIEVCLLRTRSGGRARSCVLHNWDAGCSPPAARRGRSMPRQGSRSTGSLTTVQRADSRASKLVVGPVCRWRCVAKPAFWGVRGAFRASFWGSFAGCRLVPSGGTRSSFGSGPDRRPCASPVDHRHSVFAGCAPVHYRSEVVVMERPGKAEPVRPFGTGNRIGTCAISRGPEPVTLPDRLFGRRDRCPVGLGTGLRWHRPRPNRLPMSGR
jgi:hypothetical protein